jgi:hypothetical protein
MSILGSVPAIVRPANAPDARHEIMQLWHEVQSAEHAEESASQEYRRRLLELGQRLISERNKYPSSGPRAKPWGDLLAGCGIEQWRATQAMRYAGYVEKVSDPGPENLMREAELPSLYEAGVKERHKRSASEKEPKPEQPFHILIALGDLRDGVTELLSEWPQESIPNAVIALRDIAKSLERKSQCK